MSSALRPKFGLFALGGGQHPFLHQSIQTDEIRIARKGGKALIGAVAVAGHAQRQDLPVGLPGFLEPVHKVVCFLREAADAVRGRQTADGQQNACTSLHLHVPSFYLYELGHRRIAYFGVSNALLFSAERKRGYQMSLLKHGITPREEDCVEVNTLNDAYEGPLKALLTAPDHPTAMLVSDDILAVVLEQFCGKLGLRVPKDLSIVSFNNSLFSRITSPQLTTVDVNPYQLGMEAASQTINHIENPNLLATKIIVPHKLIPRESCCPPPEV